MPTANRSAADNTPFKGESPNRQAFERSLMLAILDGHGRSPQMKALAAEIDWIDLDDLSRRATQARREQSRFL